jgi:hypothetical protein
VAISRFPHSLLCLAAACGAGGWQLALADVDFSPYATATVEHNSNVFGRPSNDPPVVAGSSFAFGDTIERALAGTVSDFAWGDDDLTVTVEGRHDNYDRFSLLDHNEYRFGGELEWHLTYLLDGTVTYQQSEYMAPLTNTLAVQLSLNREKTAATLIHMNLAPLWRLDLNPKAHELDAPLPPQYPDFHLRDESASATLNYLGISMLTAGVRVGYSEGTYYDIADATHYHQADEGLTADYAVSKLSAFSASVGYTQRTSSLTGQMVSAVPPAGAQAGGVGTTDGLTGSLSYRRNISALTSFSVRAFRNIQSYVAGANAEVDTGGDVSLTWNPDVKFAVSLDYSQSHQTIPGTLEIVGFTNRVDRTQHGDLGVKYFAFPWLTVRPYVSYDKRSSNFELANYSATIVGIDFSAHWNDRQHESN